MALQDERPTHNPLACPPGLTTTDRARSLAWGRVLWDYHRLGHAPMPADAILAFGSHDLRVAEWAADLFLAGWAPRLLLAGGNGNFTHHWDEPEADRFARVARARRVPAECLIIENRSTNTGENVRFARALMAERGWPNRRFLVVHKPHMERRAFATFRREWPEPALRVLSGPVTFEEYPNATFPVDALIHTMVGDLERILRYPEWGFQIAQPVPDPVRAAYRGLRALGYTGHCLRDTSTSNPVGTS